MGICTVVNVKYERCDIRIQRGSIWGNPHGEPHWTRSDYLENYKTHLKEQIRTGKITRADLESLRGKKLGCGCKPLPCHGDILANLVNRMFKDVPSVDDFI